MSSNVRASRQDAEQRGRRHRRRRRAIQIALTLVATLALLAGGSLQVSATPVADEHGRHGGSSGRGCTSATSPYPGGSWVPCPAAYGVKVESNVGVVMPDGVRLNANLEVPTDPSTGLAAPGPFPVLVSFTPYSITPDPFFAQHGYIVAMVSVRGTHLSQGNITFVGQQDRQDGVHVVDWAAKLPGSNGRVGLFGCSWPGEETFAVAASVGRHSPLKATIPQCIGYDNAQREVFFSGGIPTSSVAAMPLIGQTTSDPVNNPQGAAYTQAYFQALGANIMAGGDQAYIGSYYAQRGAQASDAQRIVDNGIPALLWVGWQDVVETQGLATYAALQNAVKHRSAYRSFDGVKASGKYQIIVGNWGHGGGLDDTIMLEWWDTFLKNQNTGMDRTSTPEHLFEVGSQRWINTAAYPTVNAYSTYYLGRGGSLRSGHKPSPGAQTITWEQPVDATGNPVAGSSLTYTTSPYPRGATLSGPTTATLFARSSNTNLELIPTLYDVAPDGSQTMITTGTVLGSQRAYDPRRSMYERGRLVHPVLNQSGDDYLRPGKVYQLEVGLTPTQWSILPGHSLKLQLTTQWPATCAHALLGTVPCAYTAPQLASLPGGTYTVLTGSRAPSSISLPLVSYKQFRTAAGGTTPTSNGVVLPLRWGVALAFPPVTRRTARELSTR